MDFQVGTPTYAMPLLRNRGADLTVRKPSGEVRVKGLQRSFLSWVEGHPVLGTLNPTEFNALRKKVFRATFDHYRLGVVGVEGAGSPEEVHHSFVGWLDDTAVTTLPSAIQAEVRSHCFLVALKAFHIGSQVRAGDPDVQ